eukprot:6200055-Pleurochrysis_carterae.AAC.11
MAGGHSPAPEQAACTRRSRSKGRHGIDIPIVRVRGRASKCTQLGTAVLAAYLVRSDENVGFEHLGLVAEEELRLPHRQKRIWRPNCARVRWRDRNLAKEKRFLGEGARRAERKGRARVAALCSGSACLQILRAGCEPW